MREREKEGGREGREREREREGRERRIFIDSLALHSCCLRSSLIAWTTFDFTLCMKTNAILYVSSE